MTADSTTRHCSSLYDTTSHYDNVSHYDTIGTLRHNRHFTTLRHITPIYYTIRTSLYKSTTTVSVISRTTQQRVHLSNCETVSYDAHSDFIPFQRFLGQHNEAHSTFYGPNCFTLTMWSSSLDSQLYTAKSSATAPALCVHKKNENISRFLGADC